MKTLYVNELSVPGTNLRDISCTVLWASEVCPGLSHIQVFSETLSCFFLQRLDDMLLVEEALSFASGKV